MTLENFLQRIKTGQPVSFADTIGVIDEYYAYQVTEFSNGLGADKLVNPAGVNQGSCKIFNFAKLHGLTVAQTLSLFGDYYRLDVLQHPDGSDHQNIRNFIKYGWDGIVFAGQALIPK